MGLPNGRTNMLKCVTGRLGLLWCDDSVHGQPQWRLRHMWLRLLLCLSRKASTRHPVGSKFELACRSDVSGVRDLGDWSSGL